jgi:hypothetical protein
MAHVEAQHTRHESRKAAKRILVRELLGRGFADKELVAAVDGLEDESQLQNLLDALIRGSSLEELRCICPT